MFILSENNPLCFAVKIKYEYGWFFYIILYADDTKLPDEYGGELQLLLNIVNGGNFKINISKTKAKTFSKERMTKNLWFFINKLNNQNFDVAFANLDLGFIVCCKS